MAVINYDLVRWSLKKWVTMFALIFGLHLVLIWQLSAPFPVAPHANLAGPRVAVAPSFLTEEDSVARLEDPLLFAAAHPHGFSGAAWVKKPQRNYALRIRLPNPIFLDPVTARGMFPEELPQPVMTAPNVRRARLEIGSPAVPAARRESDLRIVGPLASREALKTLKPPIQRHDDVLKNTVVEAGVSWDGNVLSARVIDASGSTRADKEALALTRSLRFKPIASAPPDQSLTWGKLIFEWFTLDLAGTNAPPK